MSLSGNQYFSGIQNVSSAPVQTLIANSLKTTVITTGFFTTQTVVGYATIVGTSRDGVTLSISPTTPVDSGNVNGLAVIIPPFSAISSISIISSQDITTVDTILPAGNGLDLQTNTSVLTGETVDLTTVGQTSLFGVISNNSNLISSLATGSLIQPSGNSIMKANTNIANPSYPTLLTTPVFLNTFENYTLLPAGALLTFYITYITLGTGV